MKKIISLLLALTMMLSMTVAVGAAAPSSGTKILSVNSPIDTNTDIDPSGITLDNTLTMNFPLYADMFNWDSNYTGGSSDAVSSKNISEGKITVRATSKSGAAASIESVSIVQKSGTANVQVRFASDAVGVTKRKFSLTMYLYVNGKRDDASYCKIDSYLMPKTNDDIISGDFVDISDGTVLIPDSAVRNVELYLGSDVTMTVNLAARQRYAGTASYEINSADRSLMNKYDNLVDVIVIRQTGLNKTGKYVEIDAGYNYFVYNAERQYIGRSNSALPFSSKYYLCNKQIDMGGSTTTTDDPVDATKTTTVTSTGTGKAIAKTNAVSLTKTALAKSKNTSVRYKDATSIASSTLQAMNAEAKRVGGTVALNADTMSGTKILGRLTIPTAGADKAASNINLGIYTDSKNTGDVKARFEKSFSNKIAVVSLAQKGSFGTKVTVIVKVDLKSFNTSNLNLYSYDKTGNKYKKIEDSGAKIDKNGYLNFKTSLGGEIVISNGPLKKR